MKFKSDIEIQAGVEAGGSTGSNGQVLSSTGSGVTWINTGTVDGSGTANRITKWLDANTITNSLFTDNGSTVGLSTSGGSNTFDLSHTSGSGIALNITKGGNGEALVLNKTSGSGNALSVTGGSYFNGNVGIGTTDPGEKLDVRGDMQMYNSFASGVEIKMSHVDPLSGYDSSIIKSVLDTISPQDSGSSMLRFYTNKNSTTSSAVALDLTKSQNAIFYGNVGIGTTSPSQKLQVTSGTVYQGVLVNGNNAPQVSFAQNSSTTPTWKAGISGTNGTAFSISQGTSNTDRLFIANGGNVGVGTTSPGAKLEVNGTLRISNTGNELQFANANVAIQRASNNLELGGYDNIVFKSSNTVIDSQTERMRITSTGNVGIGTTSPSYKLDVNGDARLNGVTFVASGASRNISTHSSAGRLQLNGGTSSSNGAYIEIAGDSYSTGDFVNIIAGTTYISGNVGIGTTSPQSLLHISSGTSGDAQIILEADTDNSNENDNPLITFKQDGGAIVGNIGLAGEAGETFTGNISNAMYMGFDTARAIQLYNNDTARLTIDTSGNVGIGTVSPNEELHIQKSSPSGEVTIEIENTDSSSASTAAKLSLKTGLNTAAIRAVSGSGGAGYLQFYNESSERMRITSTGNVGIGTTSPSAKLDVRKGGTTAAHGDTDLLVQDSTGGQSSAQVQILGGATGFSKLYFSDTAAYNVGGFIYNHTNNYLATNVNGSEKMRITPGGNVGIGTTSPSQKLTVEGNIELGTGGYIYGDTTTPSLRLSNAGGAVLTYGTSQLQNAGSLQFVTAAGIKFRINSNGGGYVVGNFGIGTTSPVTALHVEGTNSSTYSTSDSNEFENAKDTSVIINNSTTGTYANIFMASQGPSGKATGRIFLINQNAGKSAFTFQLRDNSHTGETREKMRINGSGKVSIGNTNDAYELDVTGEGRFTGDVRGLSFITTSQRDQKEGITNITKTKAKIIPFKEYTYKSSIDSSARKRYGVVAEDIENDYPELVYTGEDGIKGVNYIDLLVKRVAELEKELEDATGGFTGTQTVVVDTKGTTATMTYSNGLLKSVTQAGRR